nr:c-type cytochrome [Azohydromonas australica]
MHISRFLVRFLIPFAGLGWAAAGPAFAAALSVESISVLAGTCANCHGPDGRSSGPIPGLRGLGEERLRARLMAFREGSTPDATVMPRLMKGYDEAQIAALAKWFARDDSK